MTMPTQPYLLRQPNTWLHFIGGYYQTTSRFLEEARTQGFSRRIPAQVARGMSFGDKVIFLRYGGKRTKTVYAFGEGVITRVTFDARIARQLGEELARRGLAEYTPGGEGVQRACGAYTITGTWHVAPELDLPALVEAALRLAQANQQEPLFVMLGGLLTASYETPVFLDPPPHFTRGFIKTEPGSTFQYQSASVSQPGQILAVTNYRKAEKHTERRIVRRNHTRKQRALFA